MTIIWLTAAVAGIYRTAGPETDGPGHRSGTRRTHDTDQGRAPAPPPLTSVSCLTSDQGAVFMSCIVHGLVVHVRGALSFPMSITTRRDLVAGGHA